MNTPRITSAQRKAVAALDLPFDLSDADIARQFTPLGVSIAREDRNPMARVRELARDAMNDAAGQLKAA